MPQILASSLTHFEIIGIRETKITTILFTDTLVPTPISVMISTRKIQHIGSIVTAKENKNQRIRMNIQI